MTTATRSHSTAGVSPSRILNEGYGTGAWHGPDLAAAVGDVAADDAFRRPGQGRHNIAEIALHHAWCVRSVIAQLGGTAPEFPLPGEDWFELTGKTGPDWTQLKALLDSYQHELARLVAGAQHSSSVAMDETKRAELVLGITCHAIYHAGQIQLIKKLLTAAA